MALRIGTAFLLGILLSAPVQAQTNPPPRITAQGQGIVTAPPDTVTLNAGVTNSAQTAREALSENNRIMTRVFAALKDMAIPDRAIRTTNLYVQPQYEPVPNNNFSNPVDRSIIGYRVTNNVSVTLDDVSRAGTIMDILISSGANQTSGISYGIRNSKPLLDKARAEAVQDAMSRAKIYAAAAGVTLGPLYLITDVGASFSGLDMVMAATPAPAPPPPIGVGEQTLRVTVTGTWDVAR